MDTKILLMIICVLVIAYSVYVIITRFKKYKAATTPREKNAKLTTIVVAVILIILVGTTLIRYAF